MQDADVRTRMARYGVLNLECVRARARGRCPSAAAASVNRNAVGNGDAGVQAPILTSHIYVKMTTEAVCIWHSQFVQKLHKNYSSTSNEAAVCCAERRHCHAQGHERRSCRSRHCAPERLHGMCGAFLANSQPHLIF